MRILPSLLILFALVFIGACNPENDKVFYNVNYITEQSAVQNFAMISENDPAAIVLQANDFKGVHTIAEVFSKDIERVCGTKPTIYSDALPRLKRAIIIGTLGNNQWIDELAKQHKIETALIQGKWEASLIQTVKNPFEGIDEALVIAGSDKRGTIYGMFDVSDKIGVSPWYWWADVPVKSKSNVYVKPGIFTQGEPAVKYRGIFINDEAPALSGWVYEKYGEFNSAFYYNVFELILRLKGNYLWPAMWGRAFNFNDTLNPVLADELGIVMGTSHHEPMQRAQQEWKMFGNGAWNYNTNKAELSAFWTQGIKNMGKHESIVTIGMRGDGDEPMSEESNIALLEQIVHDQRSIIETLSGKPAAEQAQIWALYKEVQEYYDKGMRVPDDVTLLLCDDNWGNVRKLPNEKELQHPGGYGMYYHFDYVGGPRNYKWLNTNLIPRIWEQMNLSYTHGVDKIWIVNVGDIKPMELPMSFFLDYAWNPNNLTLEQLPDYTTQWATKQFGSEHARSIAKLLDLYSQYNARRKPEMLSPETYSLTSNREWETVVNNYKKLEKEAEQINTLLRDEYKAAFYQLVLYPIKACANLNELYYTVALNHRYAKQNRNLTNKMAKKVHYLFENDSLLTYHYNHILSDGKWNHTMDQTHIGYTYWQQPDYNTMPKVEIIALQKAPKMGLAVEGSSMWWTDNGSKASLPELNPLGQKSYYFELYNQGAKAFNGAIHCNDNFVLLSQKNVQVKSQQRIEVSVDWDKAPKGKTKSMLNIITDNNESMQVELSIFKPDNYKNLNKLLLNNGLEIEAEDFSAKYDSQGLQWKVIPNFGKTKSGIKTFPANHASLVMDNSNPYLAYTFYATDTGWVNVHTLLSPTLDYFNQGGLRFALALNNETPQIINMHKQAISQNWEQWVGDNIIKTQSKHYVSTPGNQSLKFYAIDAGVVLQKIIISKNAINPTYLGLNAKK